MIDLEQIKQLKISISFLVAVNNGLKDTSLLMKVLEGDINAHKPDIERAISEAVQEGLIQRIEYQVPNDHTFHCFYLPSGSKTY